MSSRQQRQPAPVSSKDKHTDREKYTTRQPGNTSGRGITHTLPVVRRSETNLQVSGPKMADGSPREVCEEELRS